MGTMFVPAIYPYCGPAPLPADLLGQWNVDPALLFAMTVLAIVHVISLHRTGALHRKRGWLIAVWLVADRSVRVAALCAVVGAVFGPGRASCCADCAGRADPRPVASRSMARAGSFPRRSRHRVRAACGHRMAVARAGAVCGGDVERSAVLGHAAELVHFRDRGMARGAVTRRAIRLRADAAARNGNPDGTARRSDHFRQDAALSAAFCQHRAVRAERACRSATRRIDHVGAGNHSLSRRRAAVDRPGLASSAPDVGRA